MIDTYGADALRMSNAAIVELFEMVTAGDIVNIF